MLWHSPEALCVTATWRQPLSLGGGGSGMSTGLLSKNNWDPKYGPLQ
jgi:hypothetical protein